MSLSIQYTGSAGSYNFVPKMLPDPIRLLAESDPSLCSLTADTMSFDVVFSQKTDFVPHKYDRVELYKNASLETVQFVVNWKRINDRRYKVECQSLISCINGEFRGRMYSPGGNQWPELPEGEVTLDPDYALNAYRTPNSLVAEILEGVDYSGDLGDTVLAGYLPVCTRREALQQVAFAIGKVIDSRSGKITFKDLPTTVSGKFVPTTILSGSNKVTWLPTVYKVAVSVIRESEISEVAAIPTLRLRTGEYFELEKNYVVDELVLDTPETVYSEAAVAVASIIEEEGSDITEGDSGIIEEGDSDIEEEPYPYEASIDYGTKWLRVVSDTDADWIFQPTASKYKEFGSMMYEKINPEATAQDKDNVLSVRNSTLLWSGMEFGYVGDGTIIEEPIERDSITPALERLMQYAQLNMLVEQRVIVTNQRAGDLVRTVTPWGSIVEGYIISMDSTLTQNGHTARVKILGKEVYANSALGVFVLGASTLGGV